MVQCITDVFPQASGKRLVVYNTKFNKITEDNL
jgi:hypothetical protein